MTLLIIFAFLGGLVTILSPCILPVLPIVLSGSLTGGKKRPLGIITGFILSFTFFTLLLSSIVKATGIPADSLRTVSVVVILLFGIALLFPQTQVLLETLLSKLSTKQNTSHKEGFGGGILIGLSLGLVWAPCVGPILASIITLAATNQLNSATFLITLAYSVGTAIPLFAITYGGRNLLNRIPWLVSNTAKIQKVFGILMILTALAIYNNYDRKFQVYILDKFPQYGAGLTSIEDSPAIQTQLEKLKTNPSANPFKKTAPEITDGKNWINSDPLTLKQLRGKVVLIDFWTYSCINCIRTLPYLRAWHESYADNGLVIIGVHSPEFEFEKVTSNVKEAVADFELKYPVVQDNDFKIWKAYNNHYWPAKYLIDKDGVIRYTHFGEGEYDTTEKKIQELLKEIGSSPEEKVTSLPKHNNQSQTPETYLGYWRIENENMKPSIKKDTFALYSPGNLKPNQFAFEGVWQINYKDSVSKKDSRLHLKFKSQDVHLVMSSDQPTTAKIYLDDKPLPHQYFGDDVLDGIVTIEKDRLYNLIKGLTPTDHTITIEFLDDNTKVFAFTFG